LLRQFAPDVLRARNTRKIAISGPYELRQGGLGLVARKALYVNDTFWGLVATVIDMPPILEEAGLYSQTGDIEIALRTSSGNMFFGNGNVFENEPVKFRIELPEGYWELGGIPSGGWHKAVAKPLLVFQATGLIISILIATIIYLLMIHAQIYQNQNLAQIDFAAYLQTLVDSLRGQYGELGAQVNIRIDAQACTLPVDTAVPLGLVVNELVSNAMKHAFPGGRAGELRIGLRCGEGGKVVLEVIDDGVGLPAGLDRHDAKSFGLRLLTLMVEEQLHGKLSMESGHGTRVVCEIGVQQ
jgi:two-component sensor histidine kinase